MINYTPSNQLTLEGFKHSFYKQLKPDNRWVKLAEVIPWDELAGIYSRNLDPVAGRLSIDIRLVIGALVIKHKMKLSDRDTVDLIGENVYMQYFCGLKSFQNEPPFDASLFVDIRKRMGADKFDEFNETVIRKAESLKQKRKKFMKDPSGDQHDTSDNTEEPGIGSRENDGSSAKKDIPNQGKLKLDASVANQYITYPMDLKLLNTARHETERMIDILYKKGDYDTKPRTYRRKARKEYLTVSKKRHKNKKELRVVIGKQLRYVRRNLSTIENMLNESEHSGNDFPLKHQD